MTDIEMIELYEAESMAERLRCFLAPKDDETLFRFLKIVAGDRCNSCCVPLNDHGVCMSCAAFAELIMQAARRNKGDS